MGESLHETGRNFVMEIMDFLISTGNFEGLVTAYNENDLTLKTKLDGTQKRFDLTGIYKEKREEAAIDVYIETKNYNKENNLRNHYETFLKDCLSVWFNMRKFSRNRKARFLFITSHPFCCNNFRELKTYEFLSEISDSFDENLKNEFDNYPTEIIISDFLNFINIMILNESRRLIFVDPYKKIMYFIR